MKNVIDEEADIRDDEINDGKVNAGRVAGLDEQKRCYRRRDNVVGGYHIMLMEEMTSGAPQSVRTRHTFVERAKRTCHNRMTLAECGVTKKSKVTKKSSNAVRKNQSMSQ
jgi:hypothetical protein